MTICGATEAQGPGHKSGHHCIGDHGHSGPHWCLLGHMWPAEPEQPLLIPPTTDTKDGAA